MRTFGLLGFPLGHSFSKTYFAGKFRDENIADCVYENFSFEKIEAAVNYLKTLDNLCGFNITIPHKRNIIPYLDQTSPVCNQIKSCNTVRVVNGRWTGFNTDVTGFRNSLVPLLKKNHTKALVFGTGGASKAVIYVLEQLNIACTPVSRSAGTAILTYDQLTRDIIASNPVLINTTPLGQFPNIERAVPIPFNGISSAHLVYDLIYNPAETLFLKNAKQRGATTKNGEEMLVLQANESWNIWNS